MKSEFGTKTTLGVVGLGCGTIAVALLVKLGIIVLIIWAIVKVLQHFGII